MSKLERLNARVAKLLTEAVHEVLGVVKETVSEYQEKTARTQRENESLKRRLQDLQDEMTRSSTAVLPTCRPLPEETEDALSQEQDLLLALRQDLGLALQMSGGHRADRDVKREPEPQESHAATEPTADGRIARREAATPIIEDATTVREYSADAESGAVSPDGACTSRCGASLGVDLAIIKREFELTDRATSEPPALQRQRGACFDLSRDSSRHDSAEADGSRAGAEPPGRAFVHSRRHGFAKTNRGAFEGRTIRMEDFAGDESHLCVVCGKTFGRLGNLRIHQRCHTGEKPYGCVQCGRRFSQAGDLKKHKRVHTGEKPYYCNQCGKSFSRGENLKRHKKIHAGEILQLQQTWRQQQP